MKIIDVAIIASLNRAEAVLTSEAERCLARRNQREIIEPPRNRPGCIVKAQHATGDVIAINAVRINRNSAVRE